nr:FAD-dependent monooxygenase [Paracoccus sp. pheM1]
MLRADFRSLRHALPFALMIPQDETEAILTQRLAGLGHCVLRPAAAERIETAADGAVVTLVDGRRIATRYAVGADGQNSTVRDQAGIAFPGKTHGSFMLADVRMGWPIPKDEVTLFFSAGGTLVVAPMSQDRYRVVAQCPEAPPACRPGQAEDGRMRDDRMGDFTPRDITLADETRRVHVGGQGPAVTVMQEMPGLSPQVVRFARWLHDAGFTVWLPSLFGVDGAKRTAEAGASIFRRACTAVAFRTLAGQGASPVTAWLRSLARLAQAECGGPGVGAVGMCFTGNFALSMMLEPAMLAPVLCQPALPLDPAALESPPRELARVRHRLGRDQRSSRPPNSIACRRPAVRFPQKRPASARKLATAQLRPRAVTETQIPLQALAARGALCREQCRLGEEPSRKTSRPCATARWGGRLRGGGNRAGEQSPGQAPQRNLQRDGKAIGPPLAPQFAFDPGDRRAFQGRAEACDPILGRGRGTVRFRPGHEQPVGMGREIDGEMPLGNGQCPVFRRVGRQLVQKQRHRGQGISRQRRVAAGDRDAHVRPGSVWREDRVKQGTHGRRVCRNRSIAEVRHRQFMRPRQGAQPGMQVGRKCLAPRRRAGAQRNQPRRQGEKVLDPVMHLAQQQRLPDEGALLCADVARDLRGTQDRSGLVRDGRNRDGYLDQRAILAAADGFEMIDLLACPQAGKDLLFLRKALVGDQHGDRLPDGFLGLVSEQLFRPPVPGRDHPVQRLGDDGVVRVLDNGRKPGIRLGGHAPSFLGLTGKRFAGLRWSLVRHRLFLPVAPSSRRVRAVSTPSIPVPI